MSQEARKEIGEAIKNYFLPIALLWKFLFCRQRVVSAIIINSKKEILLVRKRNRKHWTFPGGKKEKGKTTDEQCLERELGEELPFFCDFGMGYYKTFWGRAPHSRYFITVATYFVRYILPGDIKPGAEIEKSVWAKYPFSFKLSSVTKKIILSLRKKGKL